MNRLRDLREDRDQTLSEIGLAIGVSPMAVSQYERELRALTPDLICKFCSLYGVTADYLLGIADYPHPVVSDSDTALLRAYHAAPLEIQKIINTALTPYKEENQGTAAAAS